MPAKVTQLLGHTGVVHALLVRGQRLYSGDAEKTVRVWDISSMPPTEVHSFVASEDIVCALATAGDHLFAASFATIKV